MPLGKQEQEEYGAALCNVIEQIGSGASPIEFPVGEEQYGDHFKGCKSLEEFVQRAQNIPGDDEPIYDNHFTMKDAYRIQVFTALVESEIRKEKEQLYVS